MKTMSNHQLEDLEVWKRSFRPAVSVFELLEPVKSYALSDQMARSCISLPLYIAEGFERESNPEFRRLLAIAKGSAGELRTQLYIGQRAGIFSTEAATPLIREAREISSMIEGLRKRPGGGGFMNAIFSIFF